MRIADMKRNNYIVYFETESELFEEMEAFEQYLIQRGLKPFLRIGRTNREKLYFTFTITTPEHEEKEEILAFFDQQTMTAQYSRFQIVVEREGSRAFYPMADLSSALVLYYALRKELPANTSIELFEYRQYGKAGYIVWKDKSKNRAKDIIVMITPEGPTFQNLDV